MNCVSKPVPLILILITLGVLIGQGCAHGTLRAPAAISECENLFSAESVAGESYFQILGPDFVTFADESRFEVRDRYSPAMLEAKLNDAGILTLSVLNRDSRGELWSEEFNTQDAYRAMIAHFSGRIVGIESHWISKDGWTGNLDQLNAAMKNGDSLLAAISATWSGKRASEAGFTRATVLATKWGRGNEISEIKVLFEKP